MSGADLALNHRARERRENRGLRIDAALLPKGGDVVVAEAENVQFVGRGLQRGLRGAQIVLRLDQRRLALLVVLERNGLAFEQILGAGVLDLREIDRGLRLVQAGHGRDVIVLRLHRIGGLDHEQRLAFDDAVAGPDQKLGDAAGIGREHRRGAVLIDRDLPSVTYLGTEGSRGDR